MNATSNHPTSGSCSTAGTPSPNVGLAEVVSGLTQVVVGLSKFLESIARLGPLIPQTRAGSANPEQTPPTAGAGPSRDLQTLVGRDIRFDWVTKRIVLPSKVVVRVPDRFIPVLEFLLDNDPITKEGKRSYAAYGDIAKLFHAAKLHEKKPEMTRDDIEFRLSLKLNDPKEVAKLAHAFRREFVLWATGVGINGKSLIKCNRNSKTYGLGLGWAKPKAVLNHSAPGMVASYKADKDHEPDVSGGRKVRAWRSNDEPLSDE